MTNEIKEILDLFYNEYPKEEKILEKYITNLQKRNKELEEGFKASTEELCEYATKIDKAIEHIEHNWIDYESAKSFITYNDMLDISYLEIRQLLDILRGDE